MERLVALLFAAFTVFLSGGTALAEVSYLGPAGTYSEEATIVYFGEQEKTVPAETVSDALQLVMDGTCAYAVIPQENTIGGPVYKYIDTFLQNDKLVIVGEVNLPIRQTLLALPGTKLEDVKTVLSHPQGIAQSKEWLAKNLPQAKVVEVSSTAEGARRVAEDGDSSEAAIAASRTSNVYHLEILATDLQYTQTNVTRFYVVTTKNHQLLKAGHMALTAVGSAQYLPGLLADLQHRGFDLVSIHDRTAKTLLGEYIYVLELSGGKYDKLADLSKKYDKKLQIRLLGSFDVK